MTFNPETLKQSAWLVIFSGLLLSCNYFYQQQGVSAVVIIMVLILFLVALKLLSIHQRSKKQIELVIRALANNDPMFGLAHTDPLADKLAKVREQILNTRLEAEVQGQYLQTLLVHIDIAILVVDGNDNIVHKNPASGRLLGTIGKDVKQLAQLGSLISTTQGSQRATIAWHKGEQLDTLSVHISSCEIQGKLLKLVSIQSIYQALVAKEQQSYKRLTKVFESSSFIHSNNGAF